MADEAAQAAKNLAREMQSWKSIELRTRESFTRQTEIPDPNGVPAGRLSYHYIEKATGERYFEEAFREPTETISRYYCDGQKCADWWEPTPDYPQADRVRIKKEFGIEKRFQNHFCPVPLSKFYRGPLPLYKALEAAKWLGRETRLDRECDAFLLTRGDERRLVYVLDRETSIPLTVRQYADDAAVTADQPSYIWNATSLETIEGHPFPMKSEMISYSRSNPKTVDENREFIVESLKFNQEYPKTTFWPTIGPETRVTDAIKKTVSHVKPAPFTNDQTATTTEPLRVADSMTTDSMLGPAITGSGIILLVVCLVLWWRRQ